ncbi:phage major tail tube protein [Photobacterium leiognathi]|uniref:phage major tail tube protein n=1 Tax=Photobacterium leiognathi TaxID=553611 RepID=UPI0027384736|nr:phage major tail tube protein [Photobacterium leiognathi]
MSNWARKYSGLFIGGRSKVGDVVDYTAPVLEVVTEDFRAGGMDMPIAMDMGMNAISAGWTMGEDPDVLGLFGLKQGADMAVFVRSTLENDATGEVKQVVEELRGQLTKVDNGTWSAGKYTPTTFEMKLRYYKKIIDGTVIHEIDPVNMVRTINGVNQLEKHKFILG